MAVPQLSIVLPCFNPLPGWQQNIALHYQALQAALPQVAMELIVVNDGSTNLDSAAAAAFFTGKGIQFTGYSTNKGKGYALRHGVSVATGGLIIYTDVDFPYTPQSFLSIYQALQQGAGLAMGVRNSEYYTHLPRARVYISKFLRLLIRGLLQIPTDDTQCGLKGFNAAGRQVFLQTTIHRYLFDLEFVFLAARQKLPITMVPVNLRPGIELSHMRTGILLREGLNFLYVFYKSITG